MGYTTDFTGYFSVTPKLLPEHRAYLERFSYVRHMKRYELSILYRDDPIRIAAGILVTGCEGEFFTGSTSDFGQDFDDESIDNGNEQPRTQPGLWCQWTPNEDGTRIQWNEGEKFYNYVEWLEYLIKKFLDPWGYVLNGEVDWQGEDEDDTGTIVVKNNEVLTKQ